MKFFLMILIVIGIGISVFIDQNNTPIVTKDLKTRAINEYYATHPNSQSLPTKSFSTDGCTLFPDSFFNLMNWQDVCIEHDIAYWGGGNKMLKYVADKKLLDDGNKIFPHLGDIMSFVSNIGGKPQLPTPWRWGYGWDFGMIYKDN